MGRSKFEQNFAQGGVSLQGMSSFSNENFTLVISTRCACMQVLTLSSLVCLIKGVESGKSSAVLCLHKKVKFKQLNFSIQAAQIHYSSSSNSLFNLLKFSIQAACFFILRCKNYFKKG